MPSEAVCEGSASHNEWKWRRHPTMAQQWRSGTGADAAAAGATLAAACEDAGTADTLQPQPQQEQQQQQQQEHQQQLQWHCVTCGGWWTSAQVDSPTAVAAGSDINGGLRLPSPSTLFAWEAAIGNHHLLCNAHRNLSSWPSVRLTVRLCCGNLQVERRKPWRHHVTIWTGTAYPSRSCHGTAN